MKYPTIDILLPTYNGEKFVREQIESVLNQSYKSWRLLIRDDGSWDSTVEIARNYSSRYPEKIILIQDDKSHLGACQSFARLLNFSTADYITFCDQDDIWFPSKIEITWNKMLELEKLYDKPILLHTDVKVMDQNLKTLSDSFWKYQRVNPDRKSLNHLLIQNNVTGCSMMVNRKLKEISLPIPQEAIMYDWWMALVASAFGIIEHMKEPSLLYRQHEKSDTGAKKYSTWFFLSRINKIGQSQESIKRIIRQGKAFKERFKDKLSEQQLEIVLNFTNLFEVNRFIRLRLLSKYDLKKNGTLRNLGFFIIMALYRDKNE